jgi:hypothetical protein
MKKIWNAILEFLGFGEKPQTARERATALMQWISSQKRLDECRKQAFQAIQKDEPIHAENRTHPYEGTVRADCIKVDVALTQYYADEMTKKFGDAKYLITLLDNGISTALSNATLESVEIAIQGKISQSNPAARKLKEDLLKARQDLLIFKGANGIQRDAEDIDESNSRYVIYAFAFFEAIANIFFLREKLSSLKAMLIALVVAAINVWISAWFGNRYREKNHIDEKRSSAGRINLFYASLVIFSLNLFIAWYRFDTQGGISNSSSEFLFESIILLSVGLVLGYSAFYKGYTSDDPYPSYGSNSRKLNELETQWQFLQTQHAEFCNNLQNQAISAHTSIKERILRSQGELMAVLPEISKLVDEWASERRHLNHAYEQLQQMFKVTIGSNHPNGSNYSKTLSKLDTNSQLEHYQTQVQNLINKKDEHKTIVGKLIADVDQSERNLNAWIRSDTAEILLGWPN